MLVTVALELQMVIVMSAIRIGVIRMENKERYQKEIVEIACNGNSIAVVRSTGELRPCCEMPCRECLFNTGTSSCREEIRKWAESEYVEPPVISKRDRAFLEYLGENAKWMTKESGSEISVWLTKPEKDKSISVWTNGVYNCLSELNIDFPMVKLSDSEPWLIEDLKKLEVVENYE